jgi:sRNA-binding regulator protein Hfq
MTIHPSFSDYLLEKEDEEEGVEDNNTPLNQVLTSIRENTKIKEYYKYYPSYIVIKILTRYLKDDLDDFSKIQQYLQLIEKKHDVIPEIIHNYDFKNIQKLEIYDFEAELASNTELKKVLLISESYPNILFIYVFKYNLRLFKNRIDTKIDNKIFELFLRYKNKNSESIRNEIFLVNSTKLKDIILDQVMSYDEKFKRYLDKDETIRMLLTSKISPEKLLEYENFNFFELNVQKTLRGVTTDDRQRFKSFVLSLREDNKNKLIYFPENLEKVKEVLATIALHKKFNLVLPQNRVENYRSNLPEFLKSHVVLETDESRKCIDLQFTLFMTKGLSLVYDTEDPTLQRLVGPLLSKLCVSTQFNFDLYEKKVEIKNIFEDMFMELWLKNQMNYISHLMAVISIFFDVSNIPVTIENLKYALVVLSDSGDFTKMKTKYEDLPSVFMDMDFYFSDAYDYNKQEFLVMIWNFIVCNIETILKTRNLLRTKTILIKYILRLRQAVQCVENVENNDIACLCFCIINVANKLKKIQEKYKISINLETYVEAILQNKKAVYDDVVLPVSSSVNDISQIVSQIFLQNEGVLVSALTQSQIVKIIDRLMTFDDDDRRNIYVWLNIFSK